MVQGGVEGERSGRSGEFIQTVGKVHCSLRKIECDRVVEVGMAVGEYGT